MLRLSTLLVLSGFAVWVKAQPVVQPELTPQDTWTYRDSIERPPNVHKQIRTESTVVRFIGNSVLVSNREVGSEKPPHELLLRSDWSRTRLIAGHNTVVTRPLAFPLVAGKSWDVEYEDTRPSNPAYQSEKHQDHYRVVGWETVAVPAGKFKALKIEANGTWTAQIAAKTSPEPLTGRNYKAFWYVPAVKRPVKVIQDYFDAAGIRTERDSDELESYKVAGR
jgi:hypothetical protein